MKEYDLHQLLNDNEKVEGLITSFQEKGILRQQKPDPGEIQGHLSKAYHNLRFISETKPEFYDWIMTGCYYASYHAALALILTAGYSSKNHLATLCVLIRDFYRKNISQDDLELLFKFLDYEDILFYVESKNKREDATYSTRIRYELGEVEQLKLKAKL